MQGPQIPFHPQPAVPEKPARWRRYLPVLASGFRPFFLLAGLHAILSIPVWLAFLRGVELPQMPLPPHTWHAHEMLFGFVAAAVTGFLLTAVPNWTNRRGYDGAPLAGLVLAWLAGRLVMTVPLDLPNWLVAAIDLTFLPLLAMTILPSLMHSGNRRNLAFIGLLTLLFVSNLDFHLQGGVSTTPLLLGLNIMLFMLTMLGGRVVPAFTAAGLKQQGLDIHIRRYQPLDRAVLFAVAAVVVLDLFGSTGIFAGVTAGLAAILLTTQLVQWQGWRTWQVPLLWVLHLGYAWLAISLGLKAAWQLGMPIPSSIWLHALSVGAFATMIVGIMSRAALGHTGRSLKPPVGVVLAYFLITGAALVRVLGPLLMPSEVLLIHALASTFWTLAFGLFVFTYSPILWYPRVDGRPG